MEKIRKPELVAWRKNEIGETPVRLVKTTSEKGAHIRKKM